MTKFFSFSCAYKVQQPLLHGRLASATRAERQGDQIGRIFAFWAVATLGSFFNISEIAQIFWATVFHRASYELILTRATFWAT
jgi:hypothetical protein